MLDILQAKSVILQKYIYIFFKISNQFIKR